MEEVRHGGEDGSGDGDSRELLELPEHYLLGGGGVGLLLVGRGRGKGGGGGVHSEIVLEVDRDYFWEELGQWAVVDGVVCLSLHLGCCEYILKISPDIYRRRWGAISRIHLSQSWLKISHF